MISRFLALSVLGFLLFAPPAWAQAPGVVVLDPSGRIIYSHPGTLPATDPDAAYACVDATGTVTAVLATTLSNYTGEKLQCQPGETLRIFNQEQLPAWHDELVKQDEYLESIAPARQP